MPSITQPNLAIEQGWSDLEDGWGSGMNANLRKLDALAMPRVLDKDLSAPPGSPANGDAYIVGPSPSGVWASHEGHIARWTTGPTSPAWEYFEPRQGWSVWVLDEAKLYRRGSSSWAVDTPASPGTVAINGQSGGSYTLALSDAGKMIRCGNGSPVTVTVPTNASVAFEVGSVVSLRQTDAGELTISPAGGVTINIPTGFLAVAGRRHASLMLHKVGTDEWDITGDLKAA